MNKRIIIAAFLTIVLVAGGSFAFMNLNGEPSSPPFEKTNATVPDNNTSLPQGILNDTVTEETVTRSSLQLAQSKATISIQTQYNTDSQREETVYTPQKTYKQIYINGQASEEKYYTNDYTAIQEFQNNGYELTLERPDNRISTHTHENSLKALVNSVPLTLQNQTIENGTTYFHFDGNSLSGTASQNQLADVFSVDSVDRINEAEMTISQNGVITSATIDFRATEDGQSFPVSKTYSLEQTPDAQVNQSSWVDEAMQTNALVDAYILSDKEMVLHHQAGVTVQNGDSLSIQTPTGKVYTKEITTGFGPNTQIQLSEQDGEINMVRNANSSVENGSDFLSESGEYIVTIRTQENGTVSFTTVQS